MSLICRNCRAEKKNERMSSPTRYLTSFRGNSYGDLHKKGRARCGVRNPVGVSNAGQDGLDLPKADTKPTLRLYLHPRSHGLWNDTWRL